MDSFFGIGIMELAFIAILALIVLGPERLPGAARETAKLFGQLRALSSEFTSQFSEELQMLDEINPKKLADELTREAMNPSKKPTGATATKKDAQSKTKPLAPSQAAAGKSNGAAKKTATTADADAAAPVDAAASESAAAAAEQAPENSILPPENSGPDVSAQAASTAPATNGADPNAAAPANTPADEAPPASDENQAGTERAA